MKKQKKKREKSVFREYFELIVETAVFVFFVMTFVVQAFQIPTGSREPSLLVGDFLLVTHGCGIVHIHFLTPYIQVDISVSGGLQGRQRGVQ